MSFQASEFERPRRPWPAHAVAARTGASNRGR